MCISKVVHSVFMCISIVVHPVFIHTPFISSPSPLLVILPKFPVSSMGIMRRVVPAAAMSLDERKGRSILRERGTSMNRVAATHVR